MTAWGCSQIPIQNSSSVEENGIEYYLATDKSSYYLGEDVSIRYRVTNKTDEVRELGTVINCEYCMRQLQITLNGEDIWRTCRVPPPCGHKVFQLNPREFWEYTEAWNMANDNGTLEPEDDFPIGQGKYKVTGGLSLSEESVKISIFTEIK
jgi:hypothetical protein